MPIKPALIAIVSILFISLLTIGLIAPVWHDEGLVLLEFSGHHGWPEQIVSASALQAPLLHSHPGFTEFFANLARLNYDIHPPLYYAVLWAWRSVTGDSLLVLRLFSSLAWIGALVIFYSWSSSRFGLALLALCPMGLAFGTLARDYALSALLILLTAWLLDPDRGENDTRAILGGICAALAVWTHYFAAFPVAAIALAWAIRSWSHNRRRVIFTIAAAALAGCPVLYFARAQMRPLTNTPFLGPLGQIYKIGREFLRTPIDPFLTAGRLVDVLSSSLFLIALLIVVATFRRRSYKVRLSLLIVVLQPLALIILSWLLKSDMTAGRYLGLTLPFACLLIAEASTRLNRANSLWKLTVMAVVVFCCSAEGIRLVSLMNRQSAAFTGSTATPLVIAKETRAGGPGVPATILHDIPARADFIVLPEDGSRSRIIASIPLYSQVFYCGFDAESPADLEAVTNLPARFVRLFREYSCYVIVRPATPTQPKADLKLPELLPVASAHLESYNRNSAGSHESRPRCLSRADHKRKAV